ncbi:MAG TPA: hypothetical protein VMT04_06075 [Terriglobales bacterium]|nr:hypothetical protein [Terriglobales bacterium]
MFKRKGADKRYRFYRKRSRAKSGGKFLDLGIAFLGLMTLLFILSSAKRLTQTQAEGSLRTNPLRVQVLNSSGKKLDPNQVRSFLEKRNLSPYYLVVVEQKNLPDSLVKESFLRDRRGDEKLALQIGEKIGLKKKNIIIQELSSPDPDVDYTLILGLDYQRIFKPND